MQLYEPRTWKANGKWYGIVLLRENNVVLWRSRAVKNEEAAMTVAQKEAELRVKMTCLANRVAHEHFLLQKSVYGQVPS